MQHIHETYPKIPSPCNCSNIRRASRAVTQFYDEVLKPCGLTITQLGLLRHLERIEEPTIGELAKCMRIDRTTLNRNMKPLTDAGLLSVIPGKDSRTRMILLTEAGKTAVSMGSALWDEAQVALQEYLGENELKKLGQLLSKLEALVP